MKLIPVLFLAIVIALSSCSSAYQTAQTPDDVYYSPGKGYAGYETNNRNNNQGEYYNANPKDQYLMMKVQNPARWSTFDDYGYDGFYSPYSSFGGGYYSAFSPWITFGYWNPYSSYLSSYYMWNSCYNPYYGGVVVVGGKYSTYNTYTGLHPFNVNTYRNTGVNNRNTYRSYLPNSNNTMRNGTGFGNSIRRSFTNQNSNNNNHNFNNNRSFSQPTRSFSPSSGGGGGGLRGGGGGGFSRPGKP